LAKWVGGLLRESPVAAGFDEAEYCGVVLEVVSECFVDFVVSFGGEGVGVVEEDSDAAVGNRGER